MSDALGFAWTPLLPVDGIDAVILDIIYIYKEPMMMVVVGDTHARSMPKSPGRI